MNATLRDEVRQRAQDRCEYCQMPQSCTRLPHEADHIRAQKHNGPTALTNLCWACAHCNSHKGSDVSAFVPDSDELVRLFRPRVDNWADHFEWDGALLSGKTKIALATIGLLKINTSSRVAHRRMLMDVGSFFHEENES